MKSAASSPPQCPPLAVQSPHAPRPNRRSWCRLTEADIADFEARMRQVPPAYQPSDRVYLHGEVFEVTSYQREGMPGYWLREKEKALFFPIDWENPLQPVVH